MDRGQIILPTGCGKTIIQAELIRQRIAFGDKTFVVFSPRILLSMQLLREYVEFFSSHRIEATYLNVNSGEVSERELNEIRLRAGLQWSNINSTTSSEAIVEQCRRAIERNTPFIISCTYQSAERLLEAQRLLGHNLVDLQVNDEAHYLVSTEFQNYHAIGKRVVSFTATQRFTDDDDGWGMNNEERFGPIIYTKSPRQMVDAGEMVPPAIHIVRIQDRTSDLSNDYRCLAKCIVSSFRAHDVVVREKSRNQLSGKLMVICEGQRSLEGIMGTPEIARLRAENIRLFALCSDYGINIDGRLVNNTSAAKEELLGELQALKDDEKAVILQVDMLSEGIDVPGITGIMPIRNLGRNKFIQNLGRATRLDKTDRTRIYAGEIFGS